MNNIEWNLIQLEPTMFQKERYSVHIDSNTPIECVTCYMDGGELSGIVYGPSNNHIVPIQNFDIISIITNTFKQTYIMLEARQLVNGGLRVLDEDELRTWATIIGEKIFDVSR